MTYKFISLPGGYSIGDGCLKPATGVILFFLIWIVSVVSVRATPGAAVPWTTYEAETMLVGGGTVLGPGYAPFTIPAEASGRQCVQLTGTGQYIQFTNQSTANALVVRYCVPDTADGVGADYTVSLYTNGVLAARLPVTSKYSWLYGNYPFTNDPTDGSPRNFFDEVRTNGLNLNAGTVVRLQKDAADTATNYIIDLVDVENVPAALSQPGNSLAVTSYGAVGDGVTDCTTPFQNCINAAQSQGKSVWIPAGTYIITGTLNLVSNTKIYGAGMWYSKLVGSASLYSTPSRRLNLNGTGNNLKLSDFSILGFLNYRNDTEANDGIGGFFGTGSSISRIWIEHTKAAAWIFNSSGLYVDSCRFRNTLADGINVNYAMQNTIVTNCTARGTGDDCFALWPAPATGNYAPGNNVFTHCTGQLPFLANGGAIYGGANNRIEDCLFSDLPYGSGILFSSQFQVSYPFSGTNVAQRCDVIRCGGYDGYYGWRSAVQIAMDNYYNGIPGLNLNNLNVVDSISSGLSILGSAGPLANATATSVNIPNYNLNNLAGQHAWWASCEHGCPSGSLTVSNSVVLEYQNDSSSFTFNFLSNIVQVAVQSSVAGLGFSVDATAYTSPQNFSWIPGSVHTLAATSLQSGGAGVQYVWNSWSDNGAISHTVTASSNTNYTANFSTQNYLTTSAGPGGSIAPSSLWTNSGATVNITATVSNGYAFTGWIGSGNGSYSGTNSSATVTMNAPITETASFMPLVLGMQFLQPPANVQIGATIAPEVQVQAFDINGQPLSNAAILISLASGSGTLSGTLTRSTDAGGIAHFNDLSVNQAGPKMLAVAPVIASIPPTNSALFSVIGPAVALAFTTSPGPAFAGIPFAQQPILKTVDAFGAPSTSGLPLSLQISVSLTNSAGNLLGTTTCDLGTGGGNGVRAFSDLAVSVASTNAQILAVAGSASYGNPVAGMNIWLDGSIASSVLTNASGIVTNWLDQSGNGNNFATTIGSGGNGIRYTNTTVTGRKTVTFNATSGSTGTELKNTTCTNTSSTTSVFVVAKKTVAGTLEGPYQAVFATWAGITTKADFENTGSYTMNYNSANITPRVFRNSVCDNNCPALDPSTNYIVFEYVANGTASPGNNSFWNGLAGSTVNGNQNSNTDASYNFNVVASSVGGGLWRDGNSVNNPFAGDIAELLVYNSALNSTNRLAVENYLRSKWIVPYAVSSALSAFFNVGPASPPSQAITGVSANSATGVTLTFATTPGFTYHVEMTTNLAPVAWSIVAGSTTNASGNSATFTDTSPKTGAQQFYRTVSP